MHQKRRRGRFSDIPLKTILDLYNSGHGTTIIGRKVGLSREAIRARLRKSGIVLSDRKKDASGPLNSNWRGGRVIGNGGYVLVRTGHRSYELEHRLVMKRHLGRTLSDDEIVHHMNGIRTDNRPDNLAVTTRERHEHYTYVKCLQERVRALEEQLKSHGPAPQGPSQMRR